VEKILQYEDKLFGKWVWKSRTENEGEREHNRINLNLQFLLIYVMELNNCRITIIAMISVCVFI